MKAEARKGKENSAVMLSFNMIETCFLSHGQEKKFAKLIN